MNREMIPSLIAEGHARGHSSGNVVGTFLVIDISGFTRLTRGFMQRGRRGAEAISKLIQESIAPAVEAVERCGGIITGFAGDAFTAAFEESSDQDRQQVDDRIRLALAIIAENLAGTSTAMPGGQTKGLAIKVGISRGAATWKIVLHEAQSVAFFDGPALAKANLACSGCGPNEVGLDPSALSILPGAIGATSPVLGGEPRLIEIDRLIADVGEFDRPAEVPRCETVHKQQPTFFPSAIFESNLVGELRDVVACMLAVNADCAGEQVFASLVETALDFGGYFNKIDCSEKGCLLLVIFGAPVARDRMPGRASAFVASAMRRHTDCVRCGVAIGTAFTGFVGSSRRCEYTALGDVVNLAARLVVCAEWGSALTDEAFAKMLPESAVRDIGVVALKGFEGPFRAFRLLSDTALEAEPSAAMGGFRGRSREISLLETHLARLSDGHFAGVIHVAGPAGIGKSALIAELKQRSTFDDTKSSHRWLHLSCDEIVRKSFLPFKRCLKGLFGIDAKADISTNMDRFEARFNELRDRVADPRERESLMNAKPLLPAFVDLPTRDETIVELDMRVRYENTLLAIVAVFRATASIQPVVLQIEDFQWTDHDSHVLVQSLCRNMRGIPLLIIATCRSDRPEKVLLVEDDPEESGELIWLGAMAEEEAAEMLVSRLRLAGGAPSALTVETLEFIRERGGGNPFYMEQILLYLHENELLGSAAENADARLELPPGINMLLTARLDRLPRALRELVKAASVLGVEFSPDVLANMISIDPVEQQLRTGESEGLWRALPQLHYLFTHSLIRDAAYEMQLEGRLRQLHLAAATSYERLYQGHLQPFLPELAVHFERAGHPEQAMKYLRRAGEHALDQYQNNAAAEFFQRWLNLSDSCEPSTVDPDYLRVDALDHLGQALKQAGEWDHALERFKEAIGYANEAGDNRRRLRSLIHLGDILRYRGDYSEAMQRRLEALELAETLDDSDAKATIYGAIGNIHLCQGRLTHALKHYKMQETLAETTGNQQELSIAVGNTGIIHSRRGNLDAALECYERQFSICEDLRDVPGMANAVGNIGLVYRRRRRFDDAEVKFQQQLELAHRSGDKQRISGALGNLGVIALQRDQRRESTELFLRQQSLAEKLGDRRTIAYAAGMLGTLAERDGNLLEAERLYCLKFDLSDALDFRPGKLGALRALVALNSRSGKTSEASRWNQRYQAVEMES